MSAVAAHAGRAGQHLFQGGQAALGTVFLIEANECIDDHDRQNHQRILETADQRGQQCRAEQNQDQDAPELGKQHVPRWARRWLRQLVGTETRQAFQGLRAGEPRFRVDAQTRRHRFRRQDMRRRGWVGVGHGVIATLSTPSR